MTRRTRQDSEDGQRQLQRLEMESFRERLRKMAPSVCTVCDSDEHGPMDCPDITGQ